MWVNVDRALETNGLECCFLYFILKYLFIYGLNVLVTVLGEDYPRGDEEEDLGEHIRKCVSAEDGS